MEQYRTELHSMMEKLQAQLGRPVSHVQHKFATPVTVSNAESLLTVRWLKSQQLWRIVKVRGLSAELVPAGRQYLSDAQAVTIAKIIIRAALQGDKTQ